MRPQETVVISMASSETNERKLTKKDIHRMGLLAIGMQNGFSFERMQAPGFTMAMLPTFRKLYGDSEEDLREFMTYNMEFMNTEMHMGAFLMGLIISMEERHEDRTLIAGIRNGLFGPFAGLGDAIFWFTLLPISAAICCSLAQNGSVLGPLLYMAIWFVAAISRMWFAELGHSVGSTFVQNIGESTKYLTEASGILGMMVVGGLIPSYVSLAFSDGLVFGIGATTVQSVFDGILPNILPLGCVFFTHWLFRKNTNVLAVILGIIAFGIAMAFLGWM